MNSLKPHFWCTVPQPIWCLMWIRTSYAFFCLPDSSERGWPGSRHWTSESWEPDNWQRGGSIGMRCYLPWSHQLANQDAEFMACNFGAKWFQRKGFCHSGRLMKDSKLHSGYIINQIYKKNSFEVWTWSVMILLNPFKTVILHTKESHMASCLALAMARKKWDSYYFCWLNQTGLS